LKIIPIRLKRTEYILTLSGKVKYCTAAFLSYAKPYMVFVDHFINKICKNLLIIYKNFLFIVPDFWSVRFFDPLDEAFVWKYLDINEGVFIDIGAHVGKYTIIMAKKLEGTGTVLAFEPHPINFKLLLVNLHLNKIYNVLPFNMACYSSNGYTDLYVAEESGLHSLILPRSKNKIRIKTVMLDHIIEKLCISNIRLIKIDVEGAEVEVIKGSIKTIEKHHPTLIVEVRFSNIAELSSLLSRLNYNIRVLSSGPDVAYIVASPRC